MYNTTDSLTSQVFIEGFLRNINYFYYNMLHYITAYIIL